MATEEFCLMPTPLLNPPLSFGWCFGVPNPNVNPNGAYERSLAAKNRPLGGSAPLLCAHAGAQALCPLIADPARSRPAAFSLSNSPSKAPLSWRAPAISRAVQLAGRDNVYFLAFENNRFILDLLELIPPENVLTISAQIPLGPGLHHPGRPAPDAPPSL